MSASPAPALARLRRGFMRWLRWQMTQGDIFTIAGIKHDLKRYAVIGAIGGVIGTVVATVMLIGGWL